MRFQRAGSGAPAAAGDRVGPTDTNRSTFRGCDELPRGPGGLQPPTAPTDRSDAGYLLIDASHGRFRARRRRIVADSWRTSPRFRRLYMRRVMGDATGGQSGTRVPACLGGHDGT